jgi:alcohol dehydrogenase
MMTGLIGFDYPARTRIVFGVGAIDRIGELAKQLGRRRALLVTDQGILKAGHIDRAAKSLQASGILFTIYDAVRENPTTLDVDECLAIARAASIDLIIGIGGGSSMDTAKGCNFLLTNGGQMRDYWGVGKATKPMLPMIAVPTTAGTGSECQSFALIADAVTHQKMACGDPKAAPAIALLDPSLTLTQPRQVTADTGVDALAHAIETAVTSKRTEISSLYSREAFRLIASNLDVVLDRPEDVEARGRMQLGAALAGVAIESSMLGAAHSAANPLTAHFNVIHGRAVGLMLPHVMRFNATLPAAARAYEDLARAARLADNGDGAHKAVDALIHRVESLLNRAAIPRSARECGVTHAILPTLAAEAAGQWTAGFNPRKAAADDFQCLYQSAMNPRPD